MTEALQLITEDGVTIAGTYHGADTSHAAVLLLHMMPATKESWNQFAEKLSEKGISSLAIDLRGHGESLMKGEEKLNYREFEDEEHQAYRFDVEIAAAWIKEKDGVSDDKFAVVGASIGSNLAIRYAYEHESVRAAMALSPGLDYHGVTTKDAVRGMRRGQNLFLAVSEEDKLSFTSVKQLETAETACVREVVYLKGAGHGTTMFENDPEFMNTSLEWLVNRLS